MITGYGVIAHQSGKSNYVASGCIKVGKLDWGQRLKQIFQDITTIIEEYQPQQVAIEQVFVNKNPSSALKLGQARGVAIVAAACQDLPIGEYSPREIKQAVVGYGGAEKSQVQHMICALLNLSKAPQVDAADALAVAICHSHVSERITI